MKPEQKLYAKVKKFIPEISWIRLENLSLSGTPDLLGYNTNGHFFTVELKVCKGNKIRFSPHQIAFHIKHPQNSFIMIKLFCGCLIWNAIWCGENRILFPLQTFNSTVKKWPLVLYPNRSGVPDKLRFSSLIHDISGINFLTFAYNFCSGFKGSLVVLLKFIWQDKLRRFLSF